MLDNFVRLHNASGILRFAKRYGVLRICEHMLPASHSAAVPDFYTRASCEPLGHDARRCEPLSGWFGFAEQARGMLKIAAALNMGKPGAKSDWLAVLQQHPDAAEWAKDLDEQPDVRLHQQHLAMHVDFWLAIAQPTFRLDWPKGRNQPALILQATTFGHIALGLAASIAAQAGVSVCDGCSRVFVASDRKPRIDRRNFCDPCKDNGVPARLRKQDWRAKRGGSTNEQTT
jgi:hypothetical protein